MYHVTWSAQQCIREVEERIVTAISQRTPPLRNHVDCHGHQIYFADVIRRSMKKIPVTILGATGTVGQRLIQLLSPHPFFEIVSLAASERSAGKRYDEVVQWKLETPIPEQAASMIIKACRPEAGEHIAFSGLDSAVAGEIELAYAKAGCAVLSNAKNHRMEEDVPLVFPEINPDHLGLLAVQKKRREFSTGCIVTNSNCAIMSFVPVLYVLDRHFGVTDVAVVTLQAISGAGYPGVPSLDILGNIVPFIKDEEEKIQSEPLKILGRFENDSITPSPIRISASVNRVPVIDGHLASISVKFRNRPTAADIHTHLEQFRGLPQKLKLPLAPERPIIVHRDPSRPQPRLDANADKGMAVSVGRIRPCNVMDFKMTCLVHNTIRGAAGAAILNAELLTAQSYLKP